MIQISQTDYINENFVQRLSLHVKGNSPNSITIIMADGEPLRCLHPYIDNIMEFIGKKNDDDGIDRMSNNS